MKKFSYNKDEKLKSKIEIALLFEKGKWRTSGKIRIIMLKIESSSLSEEEKLIFPQNAKTGVSVSKRFFKKATDRNRIKRLLRESYRLNKTVFQEKFGQQYLAMLFWNSPEKPNHFEEVESEFLNLCQSKK